MLVEIFFVVRLLLHKQGRVGSGFLILVHAGQDSRTQRASFCIVGMLFKQLGELCYGIERVAEPEGCLGRVIAGRSRIPVESKCSFGCSFHGCRIVQFVERAGQKQVECKVVRGFGHKPF